MVGKNGGTARLLARQLEIVGKFMTVKNVIAQHQSAVAVTDKIAANDKGLGQAIRARLDRILKVESPLAAIAKQLLKARRVLRRGDDQDVANSRASAC